MIQGIKNRWKSVHLISENFQLPKLREKIFTRKRISILTRREIYIYIYIKLMLYWADSNWVLLSNTLRVSDYIIWYVSDRSLRARARLSNISSDCTMNTPREKNSINYNNPPRYTWKKKMRRAVARNLAEQQPSQFINF